jgi:WD40 repeat protein
LADDLRRWLDGAATAARPPRPWERTWKWARRNPAVATLTAALLFTLAGGIGGGAWQYRTTKTALASEEASNYGNRIRLAAEYIKVGQPDQADEQLERCPPSQRGWEWRYLRRLCRPDVKKLTGHTEAVLAVRFAPDGSLVATGSRDGTVRLWEAKTGRQLHVLKGHAGWVKSVSFRGDSKVLASAGDDEAVILWDTATGRNLLPLKGAGNLVAFPPSGSRVVAAGRSGRVKLFDGDTGAMLWETPALTELVSGLAFHPDGTRLAAVARSAAAVVILDAATGQEASRADFRQPRQVSGAQTLTVAAYTPDGDRLLVGTGDDIWEVDLRTMTPRPAARGLVLAVCSLALSRDGRLAGANVRGHVRQWDLSTGRLLFAPHSETTTIADLAYSPDGQTLAVPRRNEVALEPSEPRLALATRSLEGRGPDTRWDRPIAFSPNGLRLACITRDKLTTREWLLCWDVADGRLQRAVEQDFNNDDSSALFFATDGRCLCGRLCRPDPKGGAVSLLRDIDAGRDLWKLPAQHVTSDMRQPIVLSPDGQLFAWADADGTIRLHDARTLQELRQLRGPARLVKSLHFSPVDGRRLAAACEASTDGTVPVWDVETGRLALSINDEAQFTNWVRFSPDGRRLVTASIDGINIYDGTDGRRLRHLTGHQHGAEEAVFSPDGRRLATVGIDGIVRVWDADTGLELLTLTDPQGRLQGVAFSPDGNRLAASCTDGSVKLYDGSPLPELP